MNPSRSRAAFAALLVSLSLLLGAAPAGAAAPSARSDDVRLVVYGTHDRGVEVHRPRQAAHRLDGSPRGFVRFVARTVRELRADDDCTGADVGVTVNRVRSDGFARGSVNACGGYVALWKRVDGDWREIEGTQDIWTCTVLRRHDVPSAVLRPDSRCYDGTEVVAYHHR